MGCCFSGEDDGELVEETTPISKSRSYQQARKAIVVKGHSWYHGDISHQEAESRLRSGAKGADGIYLVYDSPSRSDEYVLLVYNRGEMHRWTLSERQDGKVIIGENARAHDSVQKLLDYHSGIFGKNLKLQYGSPVKLRGFIQYPEDSTLRTI